MSDTVYTDDDDVSNNSMSDDDDDDDDEICSPASNSNANENANQSKKRDYEDYLWDRLQGIEEKLQAEKRRKAEDDEWV